VRFPASAVAAAVVCALLTCVLAAAPAAAAPGDPVDFPDAELRACVNDALGQPTDATITEAQAASLSSLDCELRPISDLTGAQSLTGATSLSFQRSLGIADVSPLAGLTGLTSLNLDTNQVGDVSPLAGLVNLRTLLLSVNALVDLTPLASMSSLAEYFAAFQTPSLTVACGAPLTNPVTNLDGAVVPLSGAGYDPATNAIDTGTAGTFSYTWSAPRIPGFPSNAVFAGRLTVTVEPCSVAPVITSAAPPATVFAGDPYDWTVTASGVPAPTFAVTAGTLPPGLTLDALSGAISGTPTTAGTFPFTIAASNDAGEDSAHYVVDVEAPVAPAITSGAPPSPALVADPYAWTVTATGVPAPTFAVTAGALPDGLTLDSVTGAIGGTPTLPGTFVFTVTASNRAGTDDAAYVIRVDQPPAITSGAPPAVAAVGDDYEWTVTASGTPTPAFEVSSGALPSGLTLDGATGRISGVPTTPGTFSFTVTARNSAGSDSAAYGVRVDQAPAITSGPPPGVALAGDYYEWTVTATGEPAPVFAVTVGALPDGLSLDTSTGAISGVPIAAGTYAFSVTASNAAGTDTAEYAIAVVVATAPVFDTGVPPAGSVGAGYSWSVPATGTPAPTYAVTGGALPDGLSLDPVTGEISGTPSTTGTFAFTITATNRAGSTSATYTVRVDGLAGPGASAGGGGAAAAVERDTAALPPTGADVVPVMLAGAALLLTGAAARAFRRRRSAQAGRALRGT